jgi:mutator protein MutT
MRHTVNSVRVILCNERGEILILKRANAVHENGKWAIPGGKIEQGDTEEGTCKKEVKEETNLTVTNLKYLFSLESPPIDEQTSRYLAKYYLASFTGKVKINGESSDFQWISPMKIDSCEMAFNQKEGLKRYLSGLG